MKRRITDKTAFDSLALVVRNHILEIQNIELQLRDKAKEALGERVLSEVERDSEVCSPLRGRVLH
jgi:hypothetical protein